MELWQHQKNAAARGLSYDDGILLAHDMGCGKTYTAIYITEAKKADQILIVCPLTVMDNWPVELKKHGFNDWKILILKEKPKNMSSSPGVFYSGKKTVAKKKELVSDFIQARKARNEKYAIIINYESFWRAPLGPTYNSRTNRISKKGFFQTIAWDCFILDESHRIKTPSSKTSRFAYNVSFNSDFRILMTGTPMSKPFDVYAQFRVINTKFFGKSFHKFKLKYAEFGGFENREVLQYKNLDKLNSLFYERADVVSRNDVLELPGTSHRIVYYDISPKARKAYQELEKEFITGLESGEITSVNNALTKMLRLSQLATGYRELDEEGKDGEIVCNEIENVIADTIKDIDQKEPLIFFTVFQNEMTRVKEVLEKDGRTVGLMGMGENDLYDFQKGLIDCLVIQIRAGGAGIDLSRSRYGFYVSKNFALLDYLQSLARQDRPGQKNKVLFTHFIARNTIAEKIMTAIQKGEDLIDSVLNGYNAPKLKPIHEEDIKKAA
ncbi:MAG: DEAD/DEAH box helicase [Nanobdellota archaeon]